MTIGRVSSKPAGPVRRFFFFVRGNETGRQRPRKEAREESARERVERRGNERARKREKSVQRLKNPLHNYSPRRPSCALRGGRVRACVCASFCVLRDHVEQRRTDAERKRIEEERWTVSRTCSPCVPVFAKCRGIPSVRSRFSLADRSSITAVCGNVTIPGIATDKDPLELN